MSRIEYWELFNVSTNNAVAILREFNTYTNLNNFLASSSGLSLAVPFRLIISYDTEPHVYTQSV
jgi:hypothetical protein